MNLGPWVNAAASVVGGYNQGTQQRAQESNQNALLSYQLKRQSEQDELRKQMMLREQQQQERQQALSNRLRGLIPSNVPKAVDPIQRIDAGNGSDELFSREDLLGRQEEQLRNPVPTLPSAVPLPNVSGGQVHSAIMDQGRKPSGVEGIDWNPDDSEAGYLRRQQNAQGDKRMEEQMRRAEMTAEAQMARQSQHDASTFERQKELARLGHGYDMAEIGARGAQTRATQAVNPRGVGAAPKVTGDQRKAAAMLHRARAASQALDQFDSMDMLTAIVNKAPIFGNWADSPEGRQLRRAALAWSYAILRPESGAVIKDSELDQYMSQFIPVPEDDEATLAAKREARKNAEEGLAIMAGSAGENVPQRSSASRPSFQDRALQLKRLGKTKEQAREILKAEGYTEVGGGE